MRTLHTYIDPFVCDVRANEAQHARKLRHARTVLNRAIDRLEERIHALYSAQSVLPEPQFEEGDFGEVFLVPGTDWDDVWNTYDMKIDRLIKRVDAMAERVFEIEFELWWKHDHNA